MRVLTADPQWRLVATARSQARAEKAAALLLARTGNPHVVALACVPADLAGGARVVASLRDLLDSRSVPPVRAAIGNAGVQTVDAIRSTRDGLELTFDTRTWWAASP